MNRKDYPSAKPFLPDNLEHDALAEAAADCQGCPLYKGADQVVFGEGSLNAELMLVGQGPGPTEDEEGHPFIGDAGRMLDQALDEAGMSRDEVYITNGVKHIHWSNNGARSMAQAPEKAHIEACRPWLDAEVKMLSPRRIIAFGATAARSVLGRDVTVEECRGRFLDSQWGAEVVVTHDPAEILGLSGEEQDRLFDELVEDLQRARRPSEQPRPEMRP